MERSTRTQATLRARAAALVAAFVALVTLVGCADQDSPTEEETVDAVAVSGQFGSVPVVTFTPPLPLAESSVDVLIEGEGRELAEGEPMLLSLTAYDGEDGELVEDREVGVAQTLTLSREDVGEDLFPVLVGAQEGSRLLLRQPISEDDVDRMLLLVVDVLYTRARGEAVEPREGLPTVSLADDGAPSISLPEGEPPTALVVQPLIRGDGAQVRRGQSVTLQYTGVAWESGTDYDSTWAQGKVPQTIAIDEVFPGLRDGLVDQPVGSQVLLVIPPGLAQGTETLVLVVDILATSGGDDDAVVQESPEATEDATEETEEVSEEPASEEPASEEPAEETGPAEAATEPAAEETTG